jgi:branched-chain amino acid transport system substrate-binding protein
MDRRTYLKTTGIALGGIGLAGCNDDSSDDGSTDGGSGLDSVDIGAVVPLSGPLAATGGKLEDGVLYAAQEINENGGVEALGGAEINPIVIDSGSTPESATTAAQDLFSNNDVAAATGAFASSITLGATSVAEREGVPWVAQAWSDELTNRGFEYIYGTSLPASEFAPQILETVQNLADNAGISIGSVALVSDNNSGYVFVMDPLREALPEEGIDIAVDEVFNSPLNDATQIVRAIDEADPDLILSGVTALSDKLEVTNTKRSLDVNTPTFHIGPSVMDRNFLESSGPDTVRDVITVGTVWPFEGQQDLITSFREFSDEPYMADTHLQVYTQVHLIKEAMEQAGSADNDAIKDALDSLTITEGPVIESYPLEELSFGDNGRIEQRQMTTIQWQDAGDADFVGTEVTPFSVAPSEDAMRSPNLPW